MILLPDPPRRAHLRAFGFAVAALIALAAALVAAILRGWAWAAVAAAVVAAVGAGAVCTVPEGARRRLYAAWNRAAGTAGSLTARAVLVVMFRLVFRAAARMGSPMPLERPGGEWTLWSPCGEEPDAGSDHRTAGAAGSGWVVRYVRRLIRRPDRFWMIALLPFLGILRWVGPPPGRRIPTETYTLY